MAAVLGSSTGVCISYFEGGTEVKVTSSPRCREIELEAVMALVGRVEKEEGRREKGGRRKKGKGMGV